MDESEMMGFSSETVNKEIGLSVPYVQGYYAYIRCGYVTYIISWCSKL